MRCSECNAEVRPVVAIDIDGTMADYHHYMHVFACRYFGRHLPDDWDGQGDWEDYLGLTRRQYQDMKLAFRQGGMKRSMPVFEDAHLLWRTARELDCEIWITTTRPYNRLDSVDPDTREWLSRNRVEFDHLLYDEHKYLMMAEIVGEGRIAFILDDLPEQYEQAEEVCESGATLIQRLHNRWWCEKHPLAATVPALPAAAYRMIDAVDQWRKDNGNEG